MELSRNNMPTYVPALKLSKLLLKLLQFGGPFWRNPIHSTDFVGGLLEQVKLTKDKYGTHDRMVGLLTVVQEVGNC